MLQVLIERKGFKPVNGLSRTEIQAPLRRKRYSSMERIEGGPGDDAIMLLDTNPSLNGLVAQNS